MLNIIRNIASSILFVGMIELWNLLQNDIDRVIKYLLRALMFNFTYDLFPILIYPLRYDIKSF